MNVDQIESQGKYHKNCAPPETTQAVLADMLTEIALQLAEANESLKKIANPIVEVVNEESPWVMLSDGKAKLMIDRREVIGVCRCGPEVEMMSQVNTRRTGYIVRGTVVEVCEKLGIPTKKAVGGVEA